MRVGRWVGGGITPLKEFSTYESTAGLYESLPYIAGDLGAL